MQYRFPFIIGTLFLLIGCSHKNTTQAESAKIKSGSEAKDIRCVNDFYVLKAMQDATYENYRSQFDSLNGNYRLYQSTAAKMDKDQKELFSMALDSKLVVLCARVKYSSFINVKSIVKDIDSL